MLPVVILKRVFEWHKWWIGKWYPEGRGKDSAYVLSSNGFENEHSEENLQLECTEERKWENYLID